MLCLCVFTTAARPRQRGHLHHVSPAPAQRRLPKHWPLRLPLSRPASELAATRHSQRGLLPARPPPSRADANTPLDPVSRRACGTTVLACCARQPLSLQPLALNVPFAHPCSLPEPSLPRVWLSESGCALVATSLRCAKCGLARPRRRLNSRIWRCLQSASSWVLGDVDCGSGALWRLERT